MNIKSFLTLFALLFAGITLSAQTDPNSSGQGNGNGRCAVFTDNNKNGVCDNYENRNTTMARKNNPGRRNCCGNGRGNGCGNGYGNAKRKANSGNFTDVNKNGICDYYEAAAKK